VLEGSVNGIKAVQSADMNAVAIAIPFIDASIRTNEIIKETLIVHEPEKVAEVVRHHFEEHNLTAHRGGAVEKKGGK